MILCLFLAAQYVSIDNIVLYNAVTSNVSNFKVYMIDFAPLVNLYWPLRNGRFCSFEEALCWSTFCRINCTCLNYEASLSWNKNLPVAGLNWYHYCSLLCAVKKRLSCVDAVRIGVSPTPGPAVYVVVLYRAVLVIRIQIRIRKDPNFLKDRIQIRKDPKANFI